MDFGHTNYAANAGTVPNAYTPQFDGLFGYVSFEPIVRPSPTSARTEQHVAFSKSIRLESAHRNR